MQSEALVILLQETHCTDAEKLVFPNYQLAGFSVSTKRALATFVHERLRYTLLDQSPLTSEIEWLCVDVDGYKIVNIYEPPPTRLRSLDPWCILTHVFTLAILTVVMLTGVTIITVRTVSAWLTGQVLIVLPSYIMPRTPPVFIPAAGTLVPIQTWVFSCVGPNSRLPDRPVLVKFPRSQHRPSLITPPRFAMAVPSMAVKRRNFLKAKWSHYIALTNKFAKTLLPPDSLNVDVAYQDFCNTIK